MCSLLSFEKQNVLTLTHTVSSSTSWMVVRCAGGSGGMTTELTLGVDTSCRLGDEWSELDCSTLLEVLQQLTMQVICYIPGPSHTTATDQYNGKTPFNDLHFKGSRLTTIQLFTFLVQMNKIMDAYAAAVRETKSKFKKLPNILKWKFRKLVHRFFCILAHKSRAKFCQNQTKTCSCSDIEILTTSRHNHLYS